MTLTLASHFKIVIYSVHTRGKPGAGHEARYQAALAFVDAVEPTAQGGLARAYRNRRGELLTTLYDVVAAVEAGELAQ